MFKPLGAGSISV